MHFLSFYSFLSVESKVFLTSGFFTLFIAGVLFLKKSPYSTFFLVISAFLVSSSFALIDPYLHTWDESFHALVAKNSAKNLLSPHLYNEVVASFNPEVWTGNYIWLHKPPLAIWQMGLSIDLFGQHIYAVRLPSILAFTVTTYFVHSIAKEIFSLRIAFYSAVLFILYHFGLEQVAGIHTADHIDVSFMMYVTASFWAWIKFQKSKRKSYLVLIGFFAGLSILTKWLVGLLIFGAWAAYILQLLVQRRKSIWVELKYITISFIVSILVALPWNLYAALKYPVEYWYEFHFSQRHFSEVIENHGGDLLFYWENLSTLYGSGTLIPIIVLLSLTAIIFANCRIREKTMLLVFVLSPYLFFTIAATKMSNFVNIVSPIILICVAALFVNIVTHLNHRVRLNKYWSLLLIPLLFIFLLRPKKAIKNHLFNDHQRREYYVNSHSFIRGLEQGERDLFIYSDFYNYEHIVHMFYHPSVALNGIPEKKEMLRLQNEGYNITIIKAYNQPVSVYIPEGTKFINMD